MLGLDKKKKRLLIVDDESSVCRALGRMLASRVDEIVCAANGFEAEIVLKSEQITHVICDQWFGVGHELGMDLAAGWKKKYPSIKRVVLLTGTDITLLTAPSGIDSILGKTVDSKKLIESLNLLQD